MTLQSPRIYIYKITFEEVLYYYYGVHKEKLFDEEYWGSPKTHKWCWEFYTPKKQILQIFDYTEEGWLEAQEIEGSLIKPVYNTDKWCLNENCGGIISLSQRTKYAKKGGLVSGKKAKELGIGIFALTKEQRKEIGKISGIKNRENKTGFCGRTKEKMSEDGKRGGKIGGKKCRELGVGIYALTKKQRSENGRNAGKKAKELGIGIHALTPKQKSEAGKKGGKIAGKKAKELGLGIFSIPPEQRSEITKKVNSQKWMCLETGYISTAAGVVSYQRGKGIDTTNRIRLE